MRTFAILGMALAALVLPAAAEEPKPKPPATNVETNRGLSSQEVGRRALEPKLDRKLSSADAEIRTGAGLCLDVHAPEMGNNGGRVQVWACNGQPQQRWTYNRASRAVRVSSGLCLDVHAGINQNGNRVQVWTCNGQWQQQWAPLENGSLRSAGGLCLDVHAADQTKNGARVQIWECNGSQQQRFTSSAF